MEAKSEALSILEYELNTFKQRVIENHIRAGQKASGRTISSLRVEITSDGGIVWGRKPFATLETAAGDFYIPRIFFAEKGGGDADAVKQGNLCRRRQN